MKVSELEKDDPVREFAEKLIANGWDEDDAIEEAKRALDEAAVEDGYDGP